MTMIGSEKTKIIENMVIMYQWERCTHILYTPFLLLYDYVLERKPKIIENIVLMYQWERCTHILYTPFPLLYDYDLEWRAENYRKHCSPLAMGTVYTHSVYTVPVTV